MGCAPAISHVRALEESPHIIVHDASWKQVSVAIAAYNLARGRKLDLVRPNELVLYRAKQAPDGSEQVTSKTVYDYLFMPDSVLITSHLYRTNDLDDTNAVEAEDSATYFAEQQELSAIAKAIGKPADEGEIAEPLPTH